MPHILLDPGQNKIVVKETQAKVSTFHTVSRLISHIAIIIISLDLGQSAQTECVTLWISVTSLSDNIHLLFSSSNSPVTGTTLYYGMCISLCVCLRVGVGVSVCVLAHLQVGEWMTLNEKPENSSCFTIVQVCACLLKVSVCVCSYLYKLKPLWELNAGCRIHRKHTVPAATGWLWFP